MNYGSQSLVPDISDAFIPSCWGKLTGPVLSQSVTLLKLRERTPKNYLVCPVYADYRDCLPEIDAAVIAAPTDMHAEIAQTLLSAGKHVLVEKPLTIERDDANRLCFSCEC